MPSSFLITGGCGFIGVNLVRVLSQRGHHIRVLDNLSGGTREDLAAVTEFSEVNDNLATSPKKETVELLVGDVTNPDTCNKAVKGTEAIIHLAAQTGVIPSLDNPMFDCEQNVIGTLNMLQAAKKEGISRFVLASSAAPLGEQEQPLHEKKVPKPLSPYGASKLAAEAYCSAFHGSFGMSTVCLRFSNAYGPYSMRKGSVIATFFRRALAGNPLVIYGDGTQTRDFIHTDDLCQAMIKAAETDKDVGGEVFQIATGKETSVDHLARMTKFLVERDTDKTVEIVYEPPRKGEIVKNYADIAKARRALGYEPRMHLEEGLEKTWAWFIGRTAPM